MKLDTPVCIRASRGVFFMLHIGVKNGTFVNVYNYFIETLDKYNNSAHLCSVNKT